MGELHHAIAAGLMSRENVHAEPGEIIAGKKAGRTSDKEITVFDSTGTALQDIAAAAAIYEKAVATGKGTHFDLSAPHSGEVAKQRAEGMQLRFAVDGFPGTTESFGLC